MSENRSDFIGNLIKNSVSISGVGFSVQLMCIMYLMDFEISLVVVKTNIRKGKRPRRSSLG